MSSHGKHTANPGFKSGDHWYTCPRCSFDIYASEARKEWTGLYVCKSCWDPRHPQDLLRTRPEPAMRGPARKEVETFISVSYSYGPTTLKNHTRSGIARAGFSRSGRGSIPPEFAIPRATHGGTTSGL